MVGGGGGCGCAVVFSVWRYIYICICHIYMCVYIYIYLTGCEQSFESQSSCTCECRFLSIFLYKICLLLWFPRWANAHREGIRADTSVLPRAFYLLFPTFFKHTLIPLNRSAIFLFSLPRNRVAYSPPRSEGESTRYRRNDTAKRAKSVIGLFAFCLEKSELYAFGTLFRSDPFRARVSDL